VKKRRLRAFCRSIGAELSPTVGKGGWWYLRHVTHTTSMTAAFPPYLEHLIVTSRDGDALFQDYFGEDLLYVGFM